jgi:hypothetical protein
LGASRHRSDQCRRSTEPNQESLERNGTQIALPEQACTSVYGYDIGYAASVQNMSGVTLSSDGVFGDGWDAELASVTGDPATRVMIALTIGIGEKSATPTTRRCTAARRSTTQRAPPGPRPPR